MPFAVDAATHTYYDLRAGEYDDWFDGSGLFAERQRPGWTEELDRLVRALGALPPARTVDLACGTGYFTRYLRGLLVGVDQSTEMVRLTQERLPEGLAVVGDALNAPFADGVFDRVFTGHFYGHLDEEERTAFLREARRLGSELVVVDSALRDGVEPEGWQDRVLQDGSHHRVYKRYLDGDRLAEELGGEVLLDGEWFVVARVRWDS